MEVRRADADAEAAAGERRDHQLGVGRRLRVVRLRRRDDGVARADVAAERLAVDDDDDPRVPGRVRAQELHFCMKFNLPY